MAAQSVKEAIISLGGIENTAILTGAPRGSVEQWCSRGRVGYKWSIPFFDACRRAKIVVNLAEVIHGKKETEES